MSCQYCQNQNNQNQAACPNCTQANWQQQWGIYQQQQNAQQQQAYGQQGSFGESLAEETYKALLRMMFGYLNDNQLALTLIDSNERLRKGAEDEIKRRKNLEASRSE